MIAQLFIDPARCIGCRACEEACSECPGHGGHAMITIDFLSRADTVQTTPTVCMHCDPPACATVCPAEAIRVDDDGIVHSAAPERCIGCGNCALACPFGVPKIDERRQLMRKCDLCYDRTVLGQRPMCATVCPSGALFYGSAEDVEDLRSARPQNRFLIGAHALRTRNHLMVPAAADVVLLGPGTPVRSRAEQQLEEALW